MSTTDEKAVITKTSSLPAMTDANWGAVEDMDASDLLLPKIFQQQGQSKFVHDGIARLGDFCDSLTGEVLSPKDGKLEIIIFGQFKTMIISKKALGEKNFKLQEIVQITKQNFAKYKDLPFMETREGDDYKYNLTYNFYCLLPLKLNELPYVFSLGSTKVKVAKQVDALLYKLHKMGKPGASQVFEVRSTSEKNDQGEWYGVAIKPGRVASEKELQLAYDWYTKSKAQTFVTAEEEGAPMDDDDIPF